MGEAFDRHRLHCRIAGRRVRSRSILATDCLHGFHPLSSRNTTLSDREANREELRIARGRSGYDDVSIVSNSFRGSPMLWILLPRETFSEGSWDIPMSSRTLPCWPSSCRLSDRYSCGEKCSDCSLGSASATRCPVSASSSSQQAGELVCQSSLDVSSTRRGAVASCPDYLPKFSEGSAYGCTGSPPPSSQPEHGTA